MIDSQMKKKIFFAGVLVVKGDVLCSNLIYFPFRKKKKKIDGAIYLRNGSSSYNKSVTYQDLVRTQTGKESGARFVALPRATLVLLDYIISLACFWRVYRHGQARLFV